MKLNSFLKTHAVAIAAVLFAGGVMSFKTMEKKAATTYFYNSSDTSDNAFSDVSHWGTTNSETCITGGERPCRIVVPDGQTLSSMLSGKNNDQVLDIALQRKP